MHALQLHYFRALSKEDANALWQIAHIEADVFWTADWWAGLQRLQPGSASGTQAQESWHRHKLKKYMRTLRTSVSDCVGNLQAFTRHLCKQARLTPHPLPDVPSEPFPDRFVLWDSPALLAEGRTAASQYHACGAFDLHTDATSTYLAMKRTLATYRDGQWLRTPDDTVRPPAPGIAAALACVAGAVDERHLDEALSQVCSNIQDLVQVIKVLGTHVLVTLGPTATRWWCRASSEAHVALPAYTQVACASCAVFCMHGSCEHAHVALLQMNQISLERARLPARKAHPQTCEAMPDADLLLPTASSSSAHAQPKRRKMSQQAQAPMSQLAAKWKAILTTTGATQFLDLILAQDLSPGDVSGLDIVTLRAIFPAVPAGTLLRVLRACGDA